MPYVLSPARVRVEAKGTSDAGTTFWRCGSALGRDWGVWTAGWVLAVACYVVVGYVILREWLMD